MVELPDNFRWLIAGVTGSGKSYFTGYLMEEARRQLKRFIVLDTKKDNLRGLIQLKDVHGVQIYPNTAYNFFKVLTHDYLVFYPSERTTAEQLKQQYKQLLETIYYHDKNRIIVIEEAHRMVGQFNIEEIIELIQREGRGKGLSPMYLTQRIQDFSKLIWSQCDRTYIFRWFIPQDISYISKMIPDFDKINSELAEHDVLEYNHKNGEHKIIKAQDIKRITAHYG
jgi:DNA helicase HerA-like ATPase